MNKPIAFTPYSSRLPRSIIFILCAIVSVSCLILIGVGTSLSSIQAWLRTVSVEAPIWAAPILFVAISIVLMSLVVPKTVVSVTAGALFGTQLGGLLVTIIALSAAALNFVIGRWCFAQLIDRRIQVAVDSGANWPRALRELASEGGLGFHLLFRFAPIPSMIVNYSMGAANARMVPYLLGAAIGVLPQLLWVHGGTIATVDPVGDQNSLVSAWRPITAGVSILAAIAISVLIPKQVMRRIESMD
jgi:uncharacterized membrane protein YdjX (TVP38/TMEM64 family)